MKKDLQYYMSLDYPVTITYDAEEGYYANIDRLGFCSGIGDTLEEVYESVMISKEMWIEGALEEGIPIPEPELEKEYSGKLLLRIPKSLHAKLARSAEEDNVSLNQYLVMVLSQASSGSVSPNTEEPVEQVEICKPEEAVMVG